MFFHDIQETGLFSKLQKAIQKVLRVLNRRNHNVFWIFWVWQSLEIFCVSCCEVFWASEGRDDLTRSCKTSFGGYSENCVLHVSPFHWLDIWHLWASYSSYLQRWKKTSAQQNEFTKYEHGIDVFRGVNHSLENSRNPYKKSEISYSWHKSLWKARSLVR